jgi:hypothetical protein
MNEVNQMLNGTIPTIQPARCACGQFMMPNEYGAPCGICLAGIYEDEQQDRIAEACDMELLEMMQSVPSERWDHETWMAWARSGQKMDRREMVD